MKGRAIVLALVAAVIHFISCSGGPGQPKQLAEIPVPNNYASIVNPADQSTWWWRVEYAVGGGVTATDTVTFAVGLKGNPAHLLIS